MFSRITEFRKTLAERLEMITPDRGFNTDLGARIDLEPVVVVKNEPRLLIALSAMSFVDIATSLQKRTLQIVLQIDQLADDENAYEIAEAGLEDVIKVMRCTRVLTICDGTQFDIDISDGATLRRPEGSSYVTAVLTLNVSMTERVPVA